MRTVIPFQLFAALLILVILAGYVVRPFEKRAQDKSPVHFLKWVLLGVFIFLLGVNPASLPIVNIVFILLLGLAILVSAIVNKVRGRKFVFKSTTVSNAALMLAISLGFLLFLLFLLVSNS